MSPKEELKQVTKQIEDLSLETSAMQKRIAHLRARQTELTVLLNKPKEKITLSDHALVRYLERKYGFDFTQYREEILTESVISSIKSGAQSITVDGMKMKVEGKVIVTVI